VQPPEFQHLLGRQANARPALAAPCLGLRPGGGSALRPADRWLLPAPTATAD
jgi:hypothetical protein